MKSILKQAFEDQSDDLIVSGMEEIEKSIRQSVSGYAEKDCVLIYAALKKVEKQLSDVLSPYEKMMAKFIYKSTETAITDIICTLQGYDQESFEEQIRMEDAE